MMMMMMMMMNRTSIVRASHGCPAALLRPPNIARVNMKFLVTTLRPPFDLAIAETETAYCKMKWNNTFFVVCANH